MHIVAEEKKEVGVEGREVEVEKEARVAFSAPCPGSARSSKSTRGAARAARGEAAIDEEDNDAPTQAAAAYLVKLSNDFVRAVN